MIKLSKGLREFHRKLKELASELDSEVRDYHTTGSNHVYFLLGHGAKTTKTVVSLSPSDGRWMQAALRQARRQLLELQAA